MSYVFPLIDLGLKTVSSLLGRFSPSPQTSSGFSSIYNSLANQFGNSELGGAGGGGQFGEAWALMEKQIEIQKEMLQINMTSNISKTEHEGSMSVVRNLRSS